MTQPLLPEPKPIILESGNRLRQDPAGDGAYRAPRSTKRGGMVRSYPHTGVDLITSPGEWVRSPCNGVVTKHGICYADDHSYQYVQITAEDGLRHRLLYVKPTTGLGDAVRTGEAVGVSQNVSRRYPDSGMLPHVHYEIREGDVAYQYRDPREFIFITRC